MPEKKQAKVKLYNTKKDDLFIRYTNSYTLFHKRIKPFGKGGAHIIMPIAETNKKVIVITKKDKPNRRKEGKKEGHKNVRTKQRN